MTPLEKQKNFHIELKKLLSKYDAEILIEDFSRDYLGDNKIVVEFKWDETLIKDNDTGIIPDLVLGTFVCAD